MMHSARSSRHSTTLRLAAFSTLLALFVQSVGVPLLAARAFAADENTVSAESMPVPVHQPTVEQTPVEPDPVVIPEEVPPTPTPVVTELPTVPPAPAQGSNAPIGVEPNDVTPTLTLLTTGAPVSASPSDFITYTFQWNVANAPVTTALVVTTLPSGTKYVSSSCGTSLPCSYDDSTSTVTWNLGNRAADDTGTLTYTVQILSPLANGIHIVDSATFTSFEASATQSVATTTVSSLSTLSLTPSATPNPVAAGGIVTYTIPWSADGNALVNNLTLTATLPAGLSAVSFSNGTLNGQTISWMLNSATLPVTGTVTFTAKVDAATANATSLVVSATLSADGMTPVTKTAATTVTALPTGTPNLSITNTTPTTFANPGDSVTYTVTVKNTGTAVAKNVTVTDAIPTQLSYTDVAGTSRVFSLGDIAVDGSAMFSYTVKVASTALAGNYVNTASVQTDNNLLVSSSAILEVRIPVVEAAVVTTAPTMSIKKSVQKTTVHPGDHDKFTLTVTNTGTEAATDVRVTDTLPLGFHFIDTGSYKRAWVLGTIYPGETRTITYDTSVELGLAAATVKNTVVMTAANAPTKKTSVTVTILAGSVLGATLPETGAGMSSYVVFALGLGYLALGVFGLTALRRRNSGVVTPIRINFLG